MTFEQGLEAARELAVEYAQLGANIRGLAVAEDHDPRWGPADAAKLDALCARQAELTQRLSEALSRLEQDHREAWFAFLSGSADRLRVLSLEGERGRIAAEYEHGQWAAWSQGRPPEQVAEIFARGLSTLETHRAAIDAALLSN